MIPYAVAKEVTGRSEALKKHDMAKGRPTQENTDRRCTLAIPVATLLSP
jgi:hypothetical protein